MVYKELANFNCWGGGDFEVLRFSIFLAQSVANRLTKRSPAGKNVWRKRRRREESFFLGRINRVTTARFSVNSFISVQHSANPLNVEHGVPKLNVFALCRPVLK